MTEQVTKLFSLSADGPEMAAALRLLVGFQQELKTGHIAPKWSLEETRRAIEQLDLSAPVGTEAALGETSHLMENGDLLSASARCFGYFNPTAAGPAILGDLLAAARNPQLAVISHAPASALIERRVLGFLCEQAGWPATSGGHFTSGGSEANATALQLALNRANADYGQLGIAAFDGPPVLYASADSHLAWIKIARSAGLGTDAVRLVPAEVGRMQIPELCSMIEMDAKAGRIAVMIAATAGTTNAGEIDPLSECAEIAAQFDVHFHVDAAWAGALILDPSRRSLLSGIDRADSLTIDAHKWMSAPMGAGIIMIRQPELAGQSYSVATGYMPAGDGQDPYITTNQWSRRFIGIRLWMMLRSIGIEGYQKLFDHHFAMAALLREKLTAAGWTLHNHTGLPVILFSDPGDNLDSQKIADRIEQRGKVWLGRVDFDGKSCLRACLTSYLTGPEDIDLLLAELSLVHEELR